MKLSDIARMRKEDIEIANGIIYHETLYRPNLDREVKKYRASPLWSKDILEEMTLIGKLLIVKEEVLSHKHNLLRDIQESYCGPRRITRKTITQKKRMWSESVQLDLGYRNVSSALIDLLYDIVLQLACRCDLPRAVEQKLRKTNRNVEDGVPEISKRNLRYLGAHKFVELSSEQLKNRKYWKRGLRQAAVRIYNAWTKNSNTKEPLQLCKIFLSRYQIEGKPEYTAQMLLNNLSQLKKKLERTPKFVGK